jgi:sulfate adenylyltransferase
MRLANGLTWTIPIFLPVNNRTARLISKGENVIICDMNNTNIAILEVKEVFSFSKDKWAKKVYSTDSKEHPGVNRIYSLHDKLLGGDIWLINRPHFKFEQFNLDPLQTRQVIKERGWKTVAGFQTRNVPHRAHEYLQKMALSITDGILIHPIIGWKKDGDFKPEAIIRSYKVLIKNYFPENSVIFAGLATAMHYAGPREAVFHALVRKNYGCTHFIVGRDHAGVGDYYGKYDAHKIFDKFADLGVVPLLLKGPYYCKKCNEVTTEKICPHKPQDHLCISGTLVRKFLYAGKEVPDYLLRPEVKKVLVSYMKRDKKGGCFL